MTTEDMEAAITAAMPLPVANFIWRKNLVAVQVDARSLKCAPENTFCVCITATTRDSNDHIKGRIATAAAAARMAVAPYL